MVEYEGRCMRCKQKRKIEEPTIVEIKPGVWAVKGKCPVCGTKIFRIIGKKPS